MLPVVKGLPVGDSTVAPAFKLRLGSGESDLTLTASYTPSATFHLNHSSENSFDQAGRLDALYRFSRLTIGLHLSARSTHGSSLDVGARVARRSYYAGVTSSYSLSDKTELELNADYSVNDYDGRLGAWEVRVQPFINRRIGSKLQVGIGGAFGILQVDLGSMQTYEQWLFRAIYSPTPKLTVNASAGGEFRQTDGGKDAISDPIFSVGASWRPREKLTFTLDARRRTFGSAVLAGQNYEATGVVAGVSATLTPEFSVGLSLGYEHAEYMSILPGAIATRRDDYFYIRPSLDWRLSPHFSIGIFYEYSSNSSTGGDGRPFDRNRAGVMMSFAF